METEEVKWEDQKNINDFSRINLTLGSLETSLASKKLELGYLEDSLLELELCSDDEKIFYKIGSGFAHLSVETIREYIEQAIKTIKQEISSLNSNFIDCQSQSNVLKAYLYERFKGSINLEKE